MRLCISQVHFGCTRNVPQTNTPSLDFTFLGVNHSAGPGNDRLTIQTPATRLRVLDTAYKLPDQLHHGQLSYVT